MLVNLTKRLKVWREHNIISEEVLRRITEFERSRSNRSWVSFGMAGVGVTALLAGVISIIAANWEHLGDALKITAYFAMQVGLGIVFLKYEKSKTLLREIALALFTLLFWAGIGLFAQIYNLSGTWWQSMLFWTCITAPAVTHSNSRLLCSLWCLTAVATSGVWSAESEFFGGNHGLFITVVATTAILLSAAGLGAHSVKLISDTLKTCSIVCGIGFLLAIATPAAEAAWNVGFRFGYGFFSTYSKLAMLWCAAGLAAFVSLIRADVERRIRGATALLFIVTATFLSAAIIISPRLLHHGWARELCGAVGFIIVWSVAASAAALASMRRLFELASFVIAVRFIVIYFQVFGTLTTTGIGLIISGMVIIGVALLWNRGRRSIASRLGGNL